jgi:hypothetical protein
VPSVSPAQPAPHVCILIGEFAAASLAAASICGPVPLFLLLSVCIVLAVVESRSLRQLRCALSCGMFARTAVRPACLCSAPPCAAVLCDCLTPIAVPAYQATRLRSTIGLDTAHIARLIACRVFQSMRHPQVHVPNCSDRRPWS